MIILNSEQDQFLVVLLANDSKHEPKLLIQPNRVLSFSVPLKFFKVKALHCPKGTLVWSIADELHPLPVHFDDLDRIPGFVAWVEKKAFKLAIVKLKIHPATKYTRCSFCKSSGGLRNTQFGSLNGHICLFA